jgi:hypothetical protein
MNRQGVRLIYELGVSSKLNVTVRNQQEELRMHHLMEAKQIVLILLVLIVLIVLLSDDHVHDRSYKIHTIALLKKSHYTVTLYHPVYNVHVYT